MGSLMAGWSSRNLDPETAMKERNKSLTKEEIRNFWRSNSIGSKLVEERECYSAPSSPRSKLSEADPGRRKTWQELPEISKIKFPVAAATSTESRKEEPKPSTMSSHWWTRSNWAFLNEPPTEQNKLAGNYKAQFDVATLNTTKAF